MNRSIMTGVAAALALAGSPALAQPDFSTVEMVTTDLGDGLFLLQGAGGNIALSVGEDGTFIVDDEFTPLTDKVRAAISAQTDAPVSFILNTHWHFDHTGGNESFGESGAVIIAHDNVRTRMSAPHVFELFDMTIPASPHAALPVITFADGLTLHLNGEEIEVNHVAPAHTDGDSLVQFHGANVIHMGDIFFNGVYPLVDISSGGTADGMIAAVDLALSMIDDDTRVIPGHGPLADKADLEAYREFLIGITAAIQAEIDAGKTVEEVLAANPTAPYDDAMAAGFLTSEQFVTIMYHALSE